MRILEEERRLCLHDLPTFLQSRGHKKILETERRVLYPSAPPPPSSRRKAKTNGMFVQYENGFANECFADRSGLVVFVPAKKSGEELQKRSSPQGKRISVCQISRPSWVSSPESDLPPKSPRLAFSISSLNSATNALFGSNSIVAFLPPNSQTKHQRLPPMFWE